MLTSYRLTGGELVALCEDALAKSLKLLPASLGVVLLVGDNGELVPRFVKTSSGRGEEDFIVCSELAQEATKSKKTIIVAATSEDPRTTALVRRGVRSVAAIPLHHSGENLGLLYLDSTEALEGSAEIGAQLCDLLAAQLSAEIQLGRVLATLEKARGGATDATGPAVVDDD